MTISNRIWPLAIVGRGSSAAYYLSSINPADYAAILAVGEDDAWAGKRGHSGDANDPTLKINHPLHLIAHFSETIPGYSTELVDRLAWAGMNEAVLRGCDIRIHQAKVTNVSEARFPDFLAMEGDLGPFGFKIDMEGPKGSLSVYAYKVVVCAGTGGHRLPTDLSAAKKSFPKQVLDLNEFADLSGRDLNPQTRVVVIGPNAAIDGVHKALNYGCKIDWLIDLDAPKKPGMLATQPRVLEAWDHPDRFRLTVYRFSKYKYLDRTGAMLRLEVMPRVAPPVAGTPRVAEPAQYAMGNYIVYGIGPDGEPNKMIADTIKAKLKPIEDRTRALNSDRSKPATILGYEAEGTGLHKGFEVFGAMSGSIAREITNSSERMKALENQIEEFRKAYDIYVAILSAAFPVGRPFFAKSPQFLGRQPRGALYGQLHRELQYIVEKNPNRPHLRAALEALANQILAYHTAAAYAALPKEDPNSLTNFRDLLNQVTTHLPKGAVADHGQLTSINAALGAYATMRGNLPKYMPKQHYTTPGPPPPNGKGKPLPFVQVTTTAGDINFNLDNAQNLAIYVCVSFPNIPPDLANAFVDTVMKERHRSKIGFTDLQVATFKQQLRRMEADALSKATSKL
jgi:hypothetical protein